MHKLHVEIYFCEVVQNNPTTNIRRYKVGFTIIELAQYFLYYYPDFHGICVDSTNNIWNVAKLKKHNFFASICALSFWPVVCLSLMFFPLCFCVCMCEPFLVYSCNLVFPGLFL